MTTVDRTLARMHARVRFSAPSYLGSATPANVRGEQTFREWLDRMRVAYASVEAALADALRDRRAPIDTGTFPMRYAAWHDLSPKYLAGQLRKELAVDREDLLTLRRALPEYEPETRIVDEFASLLAREIVDIDAALAEKKRT